MELITELFIFNTLYRTGMSNLFVMEGHTNNF